MGRHIHYFFVVMGSVGVLLPLFLIAQTVDPSLVLERRAELEAELEALEGQIEGFRGVISEKQKERTSLERDVAILDAQIGKAKLEIRARNLTIHTLTTSIGEKSDLIVSLDEKIEREKVSLAELLRKVYELDQTSLVELMLAYETLSDFLVDFDNFDTVQVALKFSFGEIRRIQTVAGEERDDLEERKAEEVQLRAIQELEKKRIEEREREKQNILKITKGQEAEYQKILSSREKDAAKIRSELFLLHGSDAIPFEEAVKHANFAFQVTGVRPAFLLGVIAEESNLGANVGTGNWREDLSHSRCVKQRDAFAQITFALGLDPDQMPVSKKAWYGYCGGAMGPAQFIPTTWLLYQDRIAEVTGSNPPNPWEPRTAFIASALLLADNGAAEGTYTAERRAALRYLAGSNWSKPAYAFYGDDVMALAQKYQTQIDIISR